jgi:replication factor C subunit 3/5
LKLDKGLALEDILTQIHLFVNRLELPPRVISQLLIKMAQIEERLANGCTEKIQISSLVSAFQIARDQVSVDS